MKRTILGGLAIATLAAFGCGGPEERQAQESAQEKKAPEERITAANRPPEEIRKELSKRIDEVDQIHDKVISTLQAVQELQTEQYMRTRAGEAVQTAKMNRDQTARLLRQKLESTKDRHLGMVELSIASRKRGVEAKLTRAQRKLAAAK